MVPFQSPLLYNRHLFLGRWKQETTLTPKLDNYPGYKKLPGPTNRSYPLPSRGKIENPQVSVVGAGLTGLRCAEMLIQGAVEVTILEARDRLGGRVSLQCLVDAHIIDNSYR